ncbi:MAG: 30S ribosomal protein S4 [Patescibacteria group bacterium]
MFRPKRFKIGRRLGPLVYDQTQTERFALAEARKKKTQTKGKHKQTITAYNLALKDKQRVRMYYGIPERQFKRYVKESSLKVGNTVELLYARLEMRLDNVIYRIGLGPTHRGARQMVSHGHITVNGKKIRVPSHTVSVGDVIAIRAGSIAKKPFVKSADEKKEMRTAPSWVSYNEKANTWEIKSLPKTDAEPSVFNLSGVVEYYSR